MKKLLITTTVVLTVLATASAVSAITVKANVDVRNDGMRDRVESIIKWHENGKSVDEIVKILTQNHKNTSDKQDEHRREVKARNVKATSYGQVSVLGHVKLTDKARARNILRSGDRGEAVRKLQIKLNDLAAKFGYDIAILEDGVYGGRTQSLVERIQAHMGLNADGIVGEKTSSQIENKLNVSVTSAEAVSN